MLASTASVSISAADNLKDTMVPGEGNEGLGTTRLILLGFFAACAPIVSPCRVPCLALSCHAPTRQPRQQQRCLRLAAFAWARAA